MHENCLISMSLDMTTSFVTVLVNWGRKSVWMVESNFFVAKIDEVSDCQNILAGKSVFEPRKGGGLCRLNIMLI